MRRYLVVANQTLQAAELREELRNRISAGALFVLRACSRYQSHAV